MYLMHLGADLLKPGETEGGAGGFMDGCKPSPTLSMTSSALWGSLLNPIQKKNPRIPVAGLGYPSESIILI